jgi:CheY-like chemotaxis protein
MTRKILLADDSVTIQKVIELTFMDEEYEVVAVSNGDEAVERLESLAPDLVIADVHMPGADGFAVVRRAKQLHPAAPAVLLVGTFEPFDEGEAKASGADAHLKKPFDSQELLNLVGRLLAPSGSAAPTSAPAAPPPLAEPFSFATAGVRAPAAEVGEVFRLEPEPEPEAAPEPAEVPNLGGFHGIEVGEEFEALVADGEPEDQGYAPPEASDEELLSVDDAPFAELDASAEIAPEPFRLGDEEDDTVAEAPFHRDEAEEVAAEAPAPATAEPAASAVHKEPAAPAGAAVGPLSDADVERIARRVAEVVGERVVREVAWEVIPDLAEVVIKDRLRELEGQLD